MSGKAELLGIGDSSPKFIARLTFILAIVIDAKVFETEIRFLAFRAADT